MRGGDPDPPPRTAVHSPPGKQGGSHTAPHAVVCGAVTRAQGQPSTEDASGAFARTAAAGGQGAAPSPLLQPPGSNSAVYSQLGFPLDALLAKEDPFRSQLPTGYESSSPRGKGQPLEPAGSGALSRMERQATAGKEWEGGWNPEASGGTDAAASVQGASTNGGSSGGGSRAAAPPADDSLLRGGGGGGAGQPHPRGQPSS